MSENNYQLSYTGAMVSSLLDKANLMTVMSGATSSQAGSSGFVPAPASTDVEKFLKGDGTWATPSGGGGGGSSISYTTLLNTETQIDDLNPFSINWTAPSHGYLNLLLKSTANGGSNEYFGAKVIPIEAISSNELLYHQDGFDQQIFVSSSSSSLIITTDAEYQAQDSVYIENITQVSFS